MELVAGESLEPVLDDPEVAPALAAARMRRAAETLPALHDVPLDKVPVDADPLSPRDELGRWARTMAAVPARPGAGRRAAAASCSRPRCPAAVAPTLVHGDYRLGNLICSGTEPAALIDWEIWSVGDPRVELGWFLVFADGANFPGVGREVRGLPTADELVAAYAADGRPVDDLAWFDALGRYKMAAIMGHNLRRHREGRHHDPDQERLPDTIRRLIETGAVRRFLSTARHERTAVDFEPSATDPRPAGPPAGVHGRARLPGRGGVRRADRRGGQPARAAAGDARPAGDGARAQACGTSS